MGIRETKRAATIEKDFNELAINCASAISVLSKHKDLVKTLVAFMHDNILSNKGDVDELDRQDLRDSLVPLYVQLISITEELTEVFDIHDDDHVLWQSKLDEYLTKYPEISNEIASRYPQV